MIQGRIQDEGSLHQPAGSLQLGIPHSASAFCESQSQDALLTVSEGVLHLVPVGRYIGAGFDAQEFKPFNTDIGQELKNVTES